MTLGRLARLLESHCLHFLLHTLMAHLAMAHVDAPSSESSGCGPGFARRCLATAIGTPFRLSTRAFRPSPRSLSTQSANRKPQIAMGLLIAPRVPRPTMTRLKSARHSQDVTIPNLVRRERQKRASGIVPRGRSRWHTMALLLPDGSGRMVSALSKGEWAPLMTSAHTTAWMTPRSNTESGESTSIFYLQLTV